MNIIDGGVEKLGEPAAKATLAQGWAWASKGWLQPATPIPRHSRLQGDCRRRVLRGGSWRIDADELTTSRLSYDADVRCPGNGVRVARDPD